MVNKQKERNEIKECFKWNLDDLYTSDSQWESKYTEILEKISQFDQHKGKLKNAGSLLNCLQEKDEISLEADKLYVYANMRLHEDSTAPYYQSLADKAETMTVKFQSAVSFMVPEILSIDKDELKGYVEKGGGITLYAHYIQDIIRQKEHVLTSEMEELLANAYEIGSAPENIFAMLNNADMKFGNILDENGNETELTHGRFISMLESKNRDVRKNTFNTYYDSFIAQKNAIATIHSSSVKKDVFFARARKYTSALEHGLSDGNIPTNVYHNLISVVNSYLPAMHKYVGIRKKILGLDKVHMYDLYTPIVENVDTRIEYDNACETVLKAFKPLGDDYVQTVSEGFTSGWIDVYENRGKRSGAYSWGSYGCKPHILMNYDNKLNDMFTLAHEIGHSMHSYYTWSSQPYVYGNYSIFLAEVASTANEALLLDYLTKTTTDEIYKKYLINSYLEDFRSTLFRQTMFAEFELATHEQVEKGEPLTLENLNSIYTGLVKKYYGNEFAVDEGLSMEWARIPHFYSAFYVYQYATGFSAAVALSKNILESGNADDYKQFLRSGSSDYPINVLKKAGVDMTTPKPVTDALTVFEKLVNELEKF